MIRIGLLLIVLFSPLLQAHDARPVLVQLLETEPQLYQLTFKIPNNPSLMALPELRFPAACQYQQAPTSVMSGDGKVSHAAVRCEQSLNGQTMQLFYSVVNPGLFTLFRYTDLAGHSFSKLMKPDVSSWQVPTEITTGSVIRDYTILGAEHIWRGIDHLLFVACLLLLTAGRTKPLLLTITGFTLAHSLTLALSVLNIVRLPMAPVEASIALSILFLATELARGRRNSLTFRYPVLVSSSFGLLHGFGFAAVLRDIGLPANELAAALFSFNVGVELGQLLFIAALLVLGWLVMRLAKGLATQNTQAEHSVLSLVQGSLAGKAAVYGIGAFSAYWTIERVALFWA